MDLRGYDILTQLIPGVFFTTVIISSTTLHTYIEAINIGNAFLITVICFVIGYGINTIGQIIEAVFINDSINNKVKSFNVNGNVKGVFKLFVRFTKLKHVNKGLFTSNHRYFSQDFDELKPENEKKIEWLNQDKKFARSITSMSILLLISSLFISKILIVENNLLLYYFIQLLLLIIGVYRYFQSSIDYAFWVIKFSGQNNPEERKENRK